MSKIPIEGNRHFITGTINSSAKLLKVIRYKIRIALVVSSFLLVSIFVVFNFNAKAVPTIQGVVLSRVSNIEPFRLRSHENKLFTQDNLVGKWHIIAYGYSQCPDICPTTLMNLVSLANAIKDSDPLHKEIKETQFIFYTVDPKRDTFAVLAKYINYFHHDFIALRSNNNVNSFELSLGIKKTIMTKQSESVSYSVSHSVSILLTNPEGKLQAVFFPVKNVNGQTHYESEKLYQDLLTVVNYYYQISD